jgi:hypothetical protein
VFSFREHRSLALPALALVQRRYVNRPDGYWIASTNPQAARHARTGVLPLTGPGEVTRAGLFTDGATRAVDTFGFSTWPELLDTAAMHGPAYLVAQVRRAEREDPTRHRFKRHDDATAVVFRFD